MPRKTRTVKAKGKVRRVGSRIIAGQSTKNVVLGAAALTVVKTASRAIGLTRVAGRFGQPAETLITGIALTTLGKAGSDLVSAGVKEMASEGIEYGISWLTAGNLGLGLFGKAGNGNSNGGSI